MTYTEQQLIQQRKYNSKWYQKNKTRVALRTLQYHRELRKTVIREYGSKCHCCGEEQIKFLAIDHIDGGGYKHRQELKIGAGSRFYLWLRKNNYPKEFQILCHNCNMAKGLYKICPHQELLKD